MSNYPFVVAEPEKIGPEWPVEYTIQSILGLSNLHPVKL